MNTFSIRPSSDGQWYIVELAPNGEPLNTSEMYVNRANALRAAHQRANQYTVRPTIKIEESNDDA